MSDNVVVKSILTVPMRIGHKLIYDVVAPSRGIERLRIRFGQWCQHYFLMRIECRECNSNSERDRCVGMRPSLSLRSQTAAGKVARLSTRILAHRSHVSIECLSTSKHRKLSDFSWTTVHRGILDATIHQILCFLSHLILNVDSSIIPSFCTTDLK